MAGGGGTRFWPLSRKERPKQLLNLSGKNIMVNETIDRIAKSVDRDNIFIVTNETQAKLMVVETANRMQKDHILAEPAARNTAACIGYAAMEIVKKYEDGIMVIVPSDHFIKNEDEFSKVINAAIKAAMDTDQLVTVGIQPTFPATGYGYIKGLADSQTGIEGLDDTTVRVYSKVVEFVEKPDEDTAKEYLEDGNYTWNSGMFIWKASTILKKFETLLPDIYAPLLEIGEAMGTAKEAETIARIYPTIPKISIDYGIMERSKDVITLSGDFGWNDIGSLDMLPIAKAEDTNGNVLYGTQVCIDTKDSIVYSADQKIIATIGLKDMIVVQTKDAVLICPKERAQDVKTVVETLQNQGLDQFL